MGKPHALEETISMLRHIYLDLDFDEVFNPLFITDEDMFKQWGSETPAILDRVYYLAGLPRPNVGLSKEVKDKISQFVELDERRSRNLERVLQDYKRGNIEGDDFVESISKGLGIGFDSSEKILDLFKEFKELIPVPTNLTLRSHMTSGWFITLQALAGRSELPLKLFSIDRCFRREQREDRTHLRSHFSASCIVMDKELTPELGKEIVTNFAERLGFDKVKFIVKKRSASYYEAGTEHEAFIKLGDWIEIADFGLYSKDVLKKYKIPYDVLNIGQGAERITMIRNKINDIRELIYPQFYKVDFSDQDIAKSVEFIQNINTPDGEKLLKALLETAKQNKDAQSPCEFISYKGEFLGKKIEVKIVEPENNTKLIGPAGFNQIYVYEKAMVGLLPDSKDENSLNIIKNGVDTNISYLEAFFRKVISKIESTKEYGEYEERIPIVRSISDINITLPTYIHQYLRGKGKIDVRGPVFTTVRWNII
ncbi:MAG TPA: O-phosphoserine--tRNA ligase [Methanofastidiosum sp.]|nr:O-phosphoserine--tRNA ligase [Methanofastidiosum sp.]